jgi:hypothetical protein
MLLCEAIQKKQNMFFKKEKKSVNRNIQRPRQRYTTPKSKLGFVRTLRLKVGRERLFVMEILGV